MAYWNPSDKDAGVTLSVGNTTATTSSGASYDAVRSVTSHGSGKYYAEFASTTSVQDFCGIANATYPLGVFVGSDANSVGYFGLTGDVYNNGGSVVGTAWGSGSIVMIAFDATNGNFWVGLGGVWEGDPAAGTGAKYTGLALGTVFLAYSGKNTNVMVLRTASADFSYSIPSGFSAWDGAATVYTLMGQACL